MFREPKRLFSKEQVTKMETFGTEMCVPYRSVVENGTGKSK